MWWRFNGIPTWTHLRWLWYGHLENKVLSENQPDFNPNFYVRYVDDTLAVFNKPDDVIPFIAELRKNSCLNFTYETPQTQEFNFLDISFKVNNCKIETGIFVKDTDKGLYFNFSSFIPTNYKLSLIKTLVYRAYRLCSTWTLFDKEIKRIQTNLVNNGFPQSIVDKQINNLISKLYGDQNTSAISNDLLFYYRCYNLDSCKGDKSFLQQLFRKHVIPNTPTQNVHVRLYYKPKKLASSFSLRPRHPDPQRHGLVYQFTCPCDGCNATYIGYTMNCLATRARQHKYSQSKIYAHYVNDHSANPPYPIVDCFKVLFSSSKLRANRIAEALLIKQHKPLINVRYNEMAGGLNIF